LFLFRQYQLAVFSHLKAVVRFFMENPDFLFVGPEKILAFDLMGRLRRNPALRVLVVHQNACPAGYPFAGFLIENGFQLIMVFNYRAEALPVNQNKNKKAAESGSHRPLPSGRQD
jgi:hypothetical protein